MISLEQYRIAVGSYRQTSLKIKNFRKYQDYFENDKNLNIKNGRGYLLAYAGN